jgi:hypothetical protein
MPPGLELEFRMRLHIGAPLDQGAWDGQRRRIMPITGGTFDGRSLAPSYPAAPTGSRCA